MTMGGHADLAPSDSGAGTSRRRVVLFGPLLVAAWLVGCAGTPAPAALDVNALTAAGFKGYIAKTQEQREHLQSLAPGRLTELQVTGVHYFVYPDAAQDRVYVGREPQYAAYLKLQPEGAIPSMAKQQAEDMASYNRQDVGMQANTHRDLTDPYSDWTSLNDIGNR